MFDKTNFLNIESKADFLELAQEKGISLKKPIKMIDYEVELKQLQIELIKLQKWIKRHKKRVVIIFEGRDAAGKGGTIRRFTEHLTPRDTRVVALGVPSEIEKGQWYFRRYIKELPNIGEMVFFDRSWYNRAVVEPVNGFCDDDQYNKFMNQVPDFEHMLYEDGVSIIKFWFSISKDEQQRRFQSRIDNPLKNWKFSHVDQKGQLLWNDYTVYKEKMFSYTHSNFAPWIIIKTNAKKQARLQSIRHVLSLFSYDGKNEKLSVTNPNIVQRYHRSINQLDI